MFWLKLMLTGSSITNSSALRLNTFSFFENNNNKKMMIIEKEK